MPFHDIRQGPTYQASKEGAGAGMANYLRTLLAANTGTVLDPGSNYDPKGLEHREVLDLVNTLLSLGGLVGPARDIGLRRLRPIFERMARRMSGQNRGIREDLVSAGTAAATRVANRPKVGIDIGAEGPLPEDQAFTSFTKQAIPEAKAGMMRAMEQLGPPVHIPKDTLHEIRKVRMFVEKWKASHDGKEPREVQIAAHLKMPVEKVRHLRNSTSDLEAAHKINMTGRYNEGDFSYQIPQHDTSGSEMEVTQELEDLKKLFTPKQLEIAAKLYGENKNVSEVARELGVSRQAVQNVNNAVRKKMEKRPPIGGGSDKYDPEGFHKIQGKPRIKDMPAAEQDAHAANYRHFVNRGGPDKEPDPEIVRQLQAPQIDSGMLVLDSTHTLDTNRQNPRLRASSDAFADVMDAYAMAGREVNSVGHASHLPKINGQPIMQLKEEIWNPRSETAQVNRAEAARRGRGIYQGTTDTPMGRQSWFTEETTGSTGMMPENELGPISIPQMLQRIRDRFQGNP